MSADAVLMVLHKQIDADIAPFLRVAHARGDACEVMLYMGKDGKAAAAVVKVKTGKAC